MFIIFLPFLSNIGKLSYIIQGLLSKGYLMILNSLYKYYLEYWWMISVGIECNHFM